MTTLSTHVLNSALGRPAAGLAVALLGGDGAALEPAVTDPDGRARLTTSLEPGRYSLRFDTGPWFAADNRATLYPHIEIAFTVDPGEHHYHVALLLSPWSYTTYRGS